MTERAFKFNIDRVTKWYNNDIEPALPEELSPLNLLKNIGRMLDYNGAGSQMAILLLDDADFNEMLEYARTKPEFYQTKSRLFSDERHPDIKILCRDYFRFSCYETHYHWDVLKKLN